jgi:hypothetical protein
LLCGILAATLLLSSLTSCIFSPKQGGGPIVIPPPEYPKLIDPVTVLDALKLAYQARDSVEIKLIYDDSYRGTSFDPKAPPPGTINLTKADEVSHVEALHRASTISSIVVTYPPVKTRYTDLSDPPGWATIQLFTPALQIEINDGTTTYNLAGGYFEFKFIPTTPDSTSPTDTTWKIVRWGEYP